MPFAPAVVASREVGHGCVGALRDGASSGGVGNQGVFADHGAFCGREFHQFRRGEGKGRDEGHEGHDVDGEEFHKCLHKSLVAVALVVA